MSAPQLLHFGVNSVLKILNKRMTNLMSDRGDYRSAPATPGLLNISSLSLDVKRESTSKLDFSSIVRTDRQ